MAFAKHSIFFLTFILFSLFQAPTFATRKSYIVYLGSHSHGREATNDDFEKVTESHHELLGSFLGGSKEAVKESIFYSYTRSINGFAAVMDENLAAEMEKHPKVLKVFESKTRKLHTTRSWEFMFQTNTNGVALPHSTFKLARFGADVIIANIDTGVWPESQSFSDEGMGPIPSGWKGSCDIPKDPIGFLCNRKLIGARYFSNGYIRRLISVGMNTSDILNQLYTPRDYDGHGTHTLSTAGGSFVHGANIFGRLANGTASGGSPGARVVSYKACWQDVTNIFVNVDCYDSDILGAIDMAIYDGVHVISLSLGIGDQPHLSDDITTIATFHANKNGINVVYSGGNYGPELSTVMNLAPWTFTVAASTIDRDFQARVELQNGKNFVGSSISRALAQGSFFPMIAGAKAGRANSTIEDADFCIMGSIDPKKVEGKILVCKTYDEEDTYSRMDKGYEAMRSGAVAMIIGGNHEALDEPDVHLLPAVHLEYHDTLALYAYLKSTKNPMATSHPPKDVFNLKPSPTIAFFSSRGPSQYLPDILKPDIAAPGVNILAAYSPAASPTGFYYDNQNFTYNLMSGTSMACPHVSGVVGLLKTLHPNWSPSAIQSAIMTTAMTRDNTGHPMRAQTNATGLETKKATPFDYGSGHIRPNKAIDPGLVYDLTSNDYLDFLCGLNYSASELRLFHDAPYKCPHSYSVHNFNYPSITIPFLHSSPVNVTRILKNVGSPAAYAARVFSPTGLTINVEPKTLKFDKLGDERSFTLTIDVTRHGNGAKFGRLIWSDGKHFVRSPITVGGVKV